MNEEKNKNLRQKVKSIISIIVYIIFFGYPILVLSACTWNEAHWLTWCDLVWLENDFNDFIFMIVILSSFLAWLPIILYILFIIWLAKFINFLVWIIFFNEKFVLNKEAKFFLIVFFGFLFIISLLSFIDYHLENKKIEERKKIEMQEYLEEQKYLEELEKIREQNEVLLDISKKYDYTDFVEYIDKRLWFSVKYPKNLFFKTVNWLPDFEKNENFYYLIKNEKYWLDWESFTIKIDKLNGEKLKEYVDSEISVLNINGNVKSNEKVILNWKKIFEVYYTGSKAWEWKHYYIESKNKEFVYILEFWLNFREDLKEENELINYQILNSFSVIDISEEIWFIPKSEIVFWKNFDNLKTIKDFKEWKYNIKWEIDFINWEYLYFDKKSQFKLKIPNNTDFSINKYWDINTNWVEFRIFNIDRKQGIYYDMEKQLEKEKEEWDFLEYKEFETKTWKKWYFIKSKIDNFWKDYRYYNFYIKSIWNSYFGFSISSHKWDLEKEVFEIIDTLDEI